MRFHFYGLIVGIAVVVWWGLVEKLEPRAKHIPEILLMALLGARVYHIVALWSYYQNNLTQIPMLWNGGLSIWGALLGGVGMLLFLEKDWKNVLVAMVTALPLAQAIGRTANGVNGEFANLVWGVPWWGMEAILDLILFGLIWFAPKKWRVGAYLLGYGMIRLVLQPYRM